MIALAAALSACGGDDTPTTPEIPRSVRRDPAVETLARVERFAARPDWATLVEIVGQPHARSRELLGPHHMRYQADFETAPEGLAADERVPPVDVDEPILERFLVRDHLDLQWASAPGEPPRLHLRQRVEDRTPNSSRAEEVEARELIVLDQRAWAAIDDLGWFERPLESDLWQLWLDDAHHTARDLVELAGPVADIGSVEPTEHQGRPAVHVSLRPSDRPHPERTVEALVPWRRDATIELVRGDLVLDSASGQWLAIDFELRWSFRDAGDRPMAGRVALAGSVEAVHPPPAIQPPAAAEPVPERDRPELLRARLLDGLAGP